MLALILAGGAGSRLGLGEKPLVTIRGVPMVRYVVDAFSDAGCEVVVVLSPRTPYTRNWCRAQGITHLTAGGLGYMEDIVEAVQVLEEQAPLFTSISDLPCLEGEVVSSIRARYLDEGREALSTWVPRNLVREHGCRSSYVQVVDGVEACPAGINVLTGARITVPQDEAQVLIRDSRLAFNINTRDELARVQDTIRKKRTG